MKIIVWSKPKATINKLLGYLGIILGGLFVISTLVFVAWTYQPKKINKIDKVIPDFYAKFNYQKIFELRASFGQPD